MSTMEVRNFYNWKDTFYSDFMSKVLTLLEPRHEKKHTVIIDENEECNEIIFIMKGSIVTGYEINKQKRYCLKQKNNGIIGSFFCTFN